MPTACVVWPKERRGANAVQKKSTSRRCFFLGQAEPKSGFGRVFHVLAQMLQRLFHLVHQH